jgi:flagellar biosynthesis/type III secretory pathway protein FliH
MEIRIIGNDIEIDSEKVARIFDIRPTLRTRLEEAIEIMNEAQGKNPDEEYQLGFGEGKSEGYREGYDDGIRSKDSD